MKFQEFVSDCARSEKGVHFVGVVILAGAYRYRANHGVGATTDIYFCFMPWVTWRAPFNIPTY